MNLPLEIMNFVLKITCFRWSQRQARWYPNLHCINDEFCIKMMNCSLKNVMNLRRSYTVTSQRCRIIGEFCIKNHGLCITNDVICIQKPMPDNRSNWSAMNIFVNADHTSVIKTMNLLIENHDFGIENHDFCIQKMGYFGRCDVHGMAVDHRGQTTRRSNVTRLLVKNINNPSNPHHNAIQRDGFWERFACGGTGSAFIDPCSKTHRQSQKRRPCRCCRCGFVMQNQSHSSMKMKWNEDSSVENEDSSVEKWRFRGCCRPGIHKRWRILRH